MMGGFRDQSLNSDFKCGLFNIILLAIRRSCELMVEESRKNGIVIENHEEKIRTHLLENYLDKDEIRSKIGLANIPLRFSPEVPENYNSSTNTYIGRTDIKITSSNWLINKRDYYIVECKRIDGSSTLNENYVKDGICRFVGTSPKYSSFHKKNIMLGFVVKKIDYAKTIATISANHKSFLASNICRDITVVENEVAYLLCESEYVDSLVLSHLFYDFSSVVA